MTLSSLICASALINSSESPSEKYSSFGSPVSFTSGSTAIALPSASLWGTNWFASKATTAAAAHR